MLQSQSLSLLGGADVKAVVRNIVERLMTNDVQCDTNWIGTTGWKSQTKRPKYAPEGTTVAKVIAGKF